MADAIDGSPAIDVLADAGILGLAEQAALMLREAPRLPADGPRHRRLAPHRGLPRVPGPPSTALPGRRGGREVIATIERRGGMVLSMPSKAADADPFRRTIVESVTAELLAAELWRRTSAEER